MMKTIVVDPKVIEIKRSKYGDLLGLVNGRIRYQSDGNTIDLRRTFGKYVIEIPSISGDDYVHLKFRKGEFSITGTGLFDAMKKASWGLQ